MRIIVTFLLNAGLNFAVGLVVATLLGPSDYGHYAIGASAGALVATGAFDWLRLSTTRFYGQVQSGSEPALRSTLDRTYHVLAGIVVSGGVLAFVVPGTGLSVILVGAVVATAIANGAFDYRTALARAQFRDGAYSLLVVGKGVLALSLAGSVAWISHDPGTVLLAQAAGTLIAIVPVQGMLGRQDRSRPEGRLVSRFLRYGLPIVAANVMFQSMLFGNRTAAAARLGFAAAGQLSLVTDVELRILLAVGAAIDVLVFQLAVRSEAAQGAGAAQAQVRANMVHVGAVLLLIAVGFAGTLPAFASLVVPARFRDDFAPLALTILPGLLLFSLGQFAINPVFQMAHRTGPIIVAACLSAALDLLGLLLLPAATSLTAIGLVHSASLAAGFVFLAALAFRETAVRPPLADILGLLAASAATLLVLWPIRGLSEPLLSLALAAACGPVCFVAVLGFCDVGEVRILIRRFLRRAKPEGVPGLA